MKWGISQGDENKYSHTLVGSNSTPIMAEPSQKREISSHSDFESVRGLHIYGLYPFRRTARYAANARQMLWLGIPPVPGLITSRYDG